MVLISIHKEIIEIDLATLIYLIWNVSSHTISIVISGGDEYLCPPTVEYMEAEARYQTGNGKLETETQG